MVLLHLHDTLVASIPKDPTVRRFLGLLNVNEIEFLMLSKSWFRKQISIVEKSKKTQGEPGHHFLFS